MTLLASPQTPIAPPNPPTLLERLGQSLHHGVALIADIIGAVGIFALVYQIFEWTGKSTLLGHSSVLWAVLIGLLPFAFLIFWSVSSWVKGWRGRIRELDRALSQYQIALSEARARVSRESQKQALLAMSHIYGYHLTRRRHYVEIKSDGSAEMKDTLVFLCNRRALGSWARTILTDSASKLAGTKGTPKVVTSGPSHREITLQVDRETITRSGMVGLNEYLIFSPTITKDDGEVELTYEEDAGPKSFFFRKTDVPATATGATSDSFFVSPSEPVAELEIVIEFPARPPGLTADATFGPGRISLLQEAVEVQELFREEPRDRKWAAILKIPYPVMGVTYQIQWKLG